MGMLLSRKNRTQPGDVNSNVEVEEVIVDTQSTEATPKPPVEEKKEQEVAQKPKFKK